jgi:acyl-CoA reductase-like NAD-dependent aldehyde dehydrogenase
MKMRTIQDPASPTFSPGMTGTPTHRATEGSINACVAIDTALAELRAHADAWAHLGADRRSELLGRVVEGLHIIGPRLVAVSLEAKGLPTDGQAEGEEWVNLAISIRLARLLHRSLKQIAQQGYPDLPRPPRIGADGQTRVQVYPDDIYEGLCQLGLRGEVWMRPGISPEETLATQAWAYRSPPAGTVVAILGAGNISFLLPSDLLYRLFVECQVVALKLSPANTYLLPLLSEAFGPLISGGYLRLLTGGSTEGTYLVNHPLVDAVHLTASERTYDAVVFGTGEDALQRKAAGRPLIQKPVTAELGNVSPYIIVPGPWKPAEIQAQAATLATWAIYNHGCLCVSPRVLVQQRQWPLRDNFLHALGRVLAVTPLRPGRYPGVRETYAALLASHPEARRYGTERQDELAWAIIPDLDPAAHDEPCFTREQFGPILVETALEAPDIPAFIDLAVAFVNERLWGTLAATIVVHPETLRDPRVRAAYERALAELRYGVVTVNVHPGELFYAGMTTWGAYPGATPDNIQSGVGVVCNAGMLRYPQKSLLSGPFRPLVAPLVVGSRAMPLVARRMAEAQAHPTPLAAARLAMAALRA